MYRMIVLLGLSLSASMLFPQFLLGEQPIEFYKDLPSAEADNSAMQPYVLYFGASWCGPCNRMKSITLSVLKDTQEAKKYQWLKFDVDESPEVAAGYGAMAVPTVIVLDADQNPVGARAGFMTADQLLKFVDDSLTNPQTLPPTIDELEKLLEQATDTAELADGVQAILSELTDRERADRAEVLRLLAAQPIETQRLLLNSLEDQPLAVRAAATEALTAFAGKSIEFDPFETPQNRAQQFKMLKGKIGLEE